VFRCAIAIAGSGVLACSNGPAAISPSIDAGDAIDLGTASWLDAALVEDVSITDHAEDLDTSEITPVPDDATATGLPDLVSPDLAPSDAPAPADLDAGSPDPDASIADQDASDASPELPDAVSSPQLCFAFAPPGPDALVADIPEPDAAACSDIVAPALPWEVIAGPDVAPPQGGGTGVGPPTLDIEIGVADAQTGAFVPYVDGQWVPIIHGAQGGVHVWGAFRVALDGITGQKIQLDCQGRTYIDCENTGTSFESKTFAHPDDTKPGTWTNAQQTKPGLTVAFGSKEATPYCGLWIVLRVEVRHQQSNRWGMAEKVLRLYDFPVTAP